MLLKERKRIRELVSRFRSASQEYHFMMERWGPVDKFVENKYNNLKTEVESIPFEQLEIALKPTNFEHLHWYKRRLANLVNFYRIRLALQLEPEPNDLWEAVQPFIDAEIETFPPQPDLPYEVIKTSITEIDNQLAKNAGSDRYPLDRATLEGPITTTIAHLILELWDFIPDEEIKEYVLKSKTIDIDRVISNYISSDLTIAVKNYLIEISSPEKNKQKPQRGFFGALKAVISDEPDLPTMESILQEIEIWKSKSITELGHHQREILGRIEALTRVFDHPQRDINKAIEQGYKLWFTKHNRTQQQ